MLSEERKTVSLKLSDFKLKQSRETFLIYRASIGGRKEFIECRSGMRRFRATDLPWYRGFLTEGRLDRSIH